MGIAQYFETTINHLVAIRTAIEGARFLAHCQLCWRTVGKALCRERSRRVRGVFQNVRGRDPCFRL